MRRFSMLVAVALAAGCSDDDDGGGGGGGGATASGVAVKGPVADATVTVVALRSTGTLGETLGEGTTDATGAFAVAVSGDPGLAVATITGGTFVDEATGAPVTLQADEALIGFVDAQDGALAHAITPASTIAFSLMQYFAHDPEATLEDSIENALSATENLFGLTDIDVVAPADLTAGPAVAGPAFDHGAFNAGLSALAADTGVSTMALVGALASDARDGRLDGAAFGTLLELGGGPMPPTTGTTDLAAAVVAFLASPANASGLTAADTAVDDELAGSTGEFDKPIQVLALVDGYGVASRTVAAHLEATELPPATQVLIEAQLLEITSQGAIEIGFDIPSGLPSGLHDLVVRDEGSGLVTRLRDAVEVFDESAAPTVTATAPPAGPITGGTFLRIEGTNLGPDTAVELDGTPVVVLAHDFPRSLVVATPAHVAGAVDVLVRNGVLDALRADAFDYRDGDTRINPALPGNSTPIVFGAFRMFVDDVDGFTVQALSGRSTFSGAESGSFTLEDLTSSELAPVVATRQRSGSTFRANESLGKALLFFDQTNGLSDFVRGFTNEENGVSLGATAFGPACFFPEPTGAHVSSVARAYWANGIEADLAQGTLRQKAGWIELDDELAGSASFVVNGRGLAGTASELAFEKWTIEYNLQTNGTVNLQRNVESEVQLLTGRFSEGGELAYLSFGSKGGTLGYYLLTPVERGLEMGAFGGWTGGTLQHELQDDGAGGVETALETATYRALVSGTAEHAERLAFHRASRHDASDTDGSFQEYVGAAVIDVTPSGRIVAEGEGDLVGYVNVRDGLLLALGAFPNECTLDPELDEPMAIGGAVFRDSRKSILSLQPDRKQVAISAKLLEVGTTHHQEVGTDFFDIGLDPGTPPVVNGVPIGLAGSIPELAAATLTGLHKSTVRDDTGAVATTRGDPPAWGVSAGYSVIDDTLDLFATEVLEPGRFTGASMPRWVASGSLANDDEIAALRTSDEFLGDGMIVWVADEAVELGEPDFIARSVGLSFDPGVPSGVTSTQTDLEFGGNGTMIVDLTAHTQFEDGTFAPFSIAAGAGLVTAPGGQELRLNVPNGREPDREWQVVRTPSGDGFVGIDDSPSLDKVEFVLGVRPTGGSFGDDDRSLIVLELNPVTSRATTQQLFLAPRSGSLLTGELFTSRRDTAHSLIPGQSFAGTTTTETGLGEARVAFIGQIPALKFLFNGRDEAAGQEDLILQITPRIIQSMDE